MQNQKKGFTLIELAVTFAVIGILLSISIPSAVSYYRTYKQIERNDTAQAIYVAVQNQLIRMDGWGILNQVDSSLKEVAGDDYKTDRLVQDIPTSSGNFYYVGSEEQKIIDLIYPGNNNNDLIAFGNYVIEFNPEPGKGIVYGVFFSELDLSSSEFLLYKTASSLAYRDNDEARRNLKVGYYCGGKDFVKPAPNPNSSGKLEAKVELKNEEELYLEVNTNKASHIGTNLNDWELDLTLTGLASGKTKYWPINQATEKTASGIYFKVVLDSLKQDLSFASQFAEFIPGENIKLSARLYQKKGGLLTSASQAYDNIGPANSLFAEIDSSNNIQIAKGRHLQNLDVNTSKYAFSGTIDTVLLQNDLDWTTTQDYYVAQYGSSYQDLNFKPIVNTLLFDTNKVKTVKGVNTSGTIISNLPIIDNDLKQAGLFNEIYADIEGLTLKDCSLAIQGDEVTAGTLAGTVHGAISSCGAINSKITAPEVSKTVNIGGLVGFNDGGTITNCYARGNTSYADLSLQNKKGDIAGFIYKNAGTITKSYATGTVSSENGRAAGFAAVNSGTITKCYANAKTTGKDAAAGFVLENQAGGAVENSYALVSVKADANSGTAAGFVYNNTAQIKNCYSALAVKSGKTIWEFGETGKYDASCRYLALGAADIKETAGTWTTTPSKTVPYKDTTLNLGCNGDYIYPAIEGLDCYGDWPPVPAEKDLLMVYYEVSKSTTIDGNIYKVHRNYNFYAKDQQDNPFISSLNPGTDTNPDPIIKDGYAILSKNKYASNSVIKVNYTDKDGLVKEKDFTVVYIGKDNLPSQVDKFQLITDYTSGDKDTKNAIYDLGSQVGKDGAKIKYNSQEYYLYILPDELVQNTDYASPNFNQQISINGQSLSYNPHFAYTGNSGNGLGVIRTPRHLYNLAKYPNYQGYNYLQELDLDYQNYNNIPVLGNPSQQDSSLKYGMDFNQQVSIANFSGSYNGNNKTIYLNQVPSYGLFQQISGSLQSLNLRFYAALITGSDTRGILVNDNRGTINNCKISFDNHNFTAAPSGNFGTLVGTNYHQITNSQVNYTNSSNTITANNLQVGGFVGQNDGTIKNSFVQTENIGGVNFAVTADCFGGFCGVNKGTLSYCYFQNNKLNPSHAVTTVIQGLTASTKIGGLVGSNVTPGLIEGCYVWDTWDYYIGLSGESECAGLVVNNSGNINLCRAVGTSVSSTSATLGASGLVGANTGKITQSYTNSVVKGQIASGFVRNNNGAGIINNCYGLLNIAGNDYTAGFAAENTADISNCYTAASLNKKTGIATPFSNTSGDGKNTKCLYLSAVAVPESNGITGVGYDYLKETAFSETGGIWHLSKGIVNARSYNLELGSIYPYPGLSAPLLNGTVLVSNSSIYHYGNWNKLSVNSIGLYYYEKYSGGSEGIYLNGYELSTSGLISDTSYTSTLGSFSNSLEIEETGYGIFIFSESNDFIDCGIQFNDGSILTIPKYNPGGNPEDNFKSEGYEGYAFCEFLRSPNLKNFNEYKEGQSKVTLTYGNSAKSFSINTHFAKAVSTNPDIKWGTTEDNPALIRTAEQFDNINDSPNNNSDLNYYTGYIFKQDRNINMAANLNQGLRTISGDFRGVAVANGEFNAKYDGQGYAMDNLVISNLDATYIGLFGHIGTAGELTNLMVRGAGINLTTADRDKDRYIGLVAKNDGSIAKIHTSSNFAVSFTHTGGSGKGFMAKAYLGGLIGYNTGKVTYSGAKGDVTGKSNYGTSGNVWVGGLIGYNDNNGKTKDNLTNTLASNKENIIPENLIQSNVYLNYAAGDVEFVRDTSGNFTNWKVGGFIGNNEANSSIAYCYARGVVYSPLSDNRMGQFLGNNKSVCLFCYSYNKGIIKDDINHPNTFGFFGGKQEGFTMHLACFGYDTKDATGNLAVFVSSMSEYIDFQDKRRNIYYLLYTLAECGEDKFNSTDNIIWPNGIWVKETIDGVTLPRLINNNEADYN